MRLYPKLVITLLVAFCLTSCSTITTSGSSLTRLEQRAKDYFTIYAARQDFDRFMAFYAENASVNDVVYGFSAQGETNIRAFFDWHRGQFSTVLPGPILHVTRQVVSSDQVITEGQFHQFKYNGQTLGPWEFVIWQQYSAQGLILQQQDWINYSPKKILITP